MELIPAAWIDGWRRVARAPWILAGAVVCSVASAVPFVLVMRHMMASHLGRSLAAEEAARGVNSEWWQEFLSQASDLGSTFSPRIIGFAATLDTLSGVADGRTEVGLVTALVAGYVLAWTFFSAGIIDRYARNRPTRGTGFAAACGAQAGGFSRLAVAGCLAYGWVFVYLQPWLLDVRYVRLTRDLDSERAAFAWRVAAYVLVGAIMAGINVVLDYAKIRMVVEDRRSATGALGAALRFVWRHKAATGGLYLVNTIVCTSLLAGWSAVAPSAGPAGVRMWLAFLVGQAFITARLAIKLHFLASQTALFQRSLAHARYTAATRYRRPDSPAVEALGAPVAGGSASALQL